MTNLDIIKGYTTEEMADFLYARISRCNECPITTRCRIEHQGANKCTSALRTWLNQKQAVN
jgi:hypothetical protein